MKKRNQRFARVMKNLKNNMDLSGLWKGAAIGFPIQLIGELFNVTGKFSWKRLLGVTAQTAVAYTISYNVTKAIVDTNLEEMEENDEPETTSSNDMNEVLLNFIHEAVKTAPHMSVEDLEKWASSDDSNSFKEVL